MRRLRISRCCGCLLSLSIVDQRVLHLIKMWLEWAEARNQRCRGSTESIRISAQRHQSCPQQDPQIESKTPIVDIPQIKFNSLLHLMKLSRRLHLLSAGRWVGGGPAAARTDRQTNRNRAEGRDHPAGCLSRPNYAGSGGLARNPPALS